MVERGNPLPQGDYFPPRENGWGRNERSYLDIPQDGRFNPPQQIHAREMVGRPCSLSQRELTLPKTVEQALRDCARIPIKEFALAVTLDNGEEKMYSSTALIPYRQRFFSDRFRQDFHRSVRRAAMDGPYVGAGMVSALPIARGHADGAHAASAFGQDAMYNEFEIDSGHETRKSSGGSSSEMSRRQQRKSRSDESDEDGSSSAKRKRPRGSFYPYPYRENSNEDTPVPVPVRKTQQLMIGDDVEVEKYYHVRFKDMQQSSCKVMGKAFVKLVEPKKQTHHPYTKGDDKAPPWWPNTTGENSVRHKEPDHLLKPGQFHDESVSGKSRVDMCCYRADPPPGARFEDDHRAARQAVPHRSEAGAQCEETGRGHDGGHVELV